MGCSGSIPEESKSSPPSARSDGSESGAKGKHRIRFKGFGSDWRKGPTHSTGTFAENYSIQEKDKLGAGAYGKVYKGRAKNPGDSKPKEVAVKVFSKEGPSWQTYEKDLFKEVKILQQLNHPNIVRCIDFYKEKKKDFVCLELLEGGDLFESVVTRQSKYDIPYNEGEAREIVFVLLETLRYLHNRDIMHRDLKPENLLLISKEDNAHVIKLADFGFADKASSLKQRDKCGTPGYMAPEIVLERPYGKPCDMFSAGVITFILLAGYSPFHGAGLNRAAINNAVASGRWKFDQSGGWGNVSAAGKDLIKKLMAFDQKKRLTAEGALNHEWMQIAKSELANKPLDQAMKQLRRYNAKRRLMSYVRLVIAANKMRRLSVAFKGGDWTALKTQK